MRRCRKTVVATLKNPGNACGVGPIVKDSGDVGGQLERTPEVAEIRLAPHNRRIDELSGRALDDQEGDSDDIVVLFDRGWLGQPFGGSAATVGTVGRRGIEVDQPQVAVGREDEVGGLDVGVGDARLVDPTQRVGGMGADPTALGLCERTVGGE